MGHIEPNRTIGFSTADIQIICDQVPIAEQTVLTLAKYRVVSFISTRGLLGEEPWQKSLVLVPR